MINPVKQLNVKATLKLAYVLLHFVVIYNKIIFIILCINYFLTKIF